MFKVNRVHSSEKVPENWVDFVVLIWEEDDARPPDRERPHQAYERITGDKYPEKSDEPIAAVDLGDCFFSLYSGGWVLCHSCEGGAVGVLLKEKP